MAICSLYISAQDLVRPKSFLGKRTSGKDLSDLVLNLVTALNRQEIPNVASMLQVFNHDLVRYLPLGAGFGSPIHHCLNVLLSLLASNNLGVEKRPSIQDRSEFRGPAFG